MAKKVSNGLDLVNQKITNLGDPTNLTDAANKQYVDNVAAGLYWKLPVRAASTGNVSLTAPGTTLDGITLSTGDRVLLKNQTTGSENGIYIWSGGSTTLVRSTDANSGTELNPGTIVMVVSGTVNGDLAFMVISDAAVTIGTTATTWGQFNPGVVFTASNGVQKIGNDFSGVVAPSGGISVGATGFTLDRTVAVVKVIGTFGNGSLTSIPVTHNLATKDVVVSVRIVATDEEELVEWIATDVNTVTFTYASAPASNSRRFVIHG